MTKNSNSQFLLCKSTGLSAAFFRRENFQKQILEMERLPVVIAVLFT